MSFNWVDGVLNLSPTKGADRLVLIVLADSAKRYTGETHLTVAQIAKLANLGESTVRECLRRLEQSDEIATPKMALGRGNHSPHFVNPKYDGYRNEKGPDSGPFSKQKRGQITDERGQITDERGQITDTDTLLDKTCINRDKPVNSAREKTPLKPTYIPDDWGPTESDIAYCQEHLPGEDVNAVATEFTEYWQNLGSAGKRYVNWSLVFKKRVQTLVKNPRLRPSWLDPGNVQQKSQSRRDSYTVDFDAMAERLMAERQISA